MSTLLRTFALLLPLTLVGCADASVEHGSARQPRDGYTYARVTRVFDGDSFAAIDSAGTAIEVRLSEIDAPEKDEPWSNRARQRLTGLIADRDVAIRRFDVDTYGRVVGRVFVNGTDTSELLVSEGLAAVYVRFARDENLFALEEQARREKRGFWGSSYRPRGAKSGRRNRTTSAQVDGCGSKRYCREMTSCEEALFYLRECGLSTIDGNGDGVPCEKICSTP